jgi:DNA-binding NtrC family response regulator/NAD-dependent dihydropyrimidine dehydrogenase PreA subunit
MDIIRTDRERCRGCHACVRHCPVKAIRVTSAGTTDVSPGRCIGCGRCLQVCSQQARSAVTDLERARRLLGRREPAVAVLAPAFPAYVGDLRPGQLVAALLRLGFQGVREGAVGTDLLAVRPEIRPAAPKQPPVILSHCPAVVALTERHFPQLLRNLCPTVSPLVAAARAIRASATGPVRVITFGSCFAAKLEAADDQMAEDVDAALTFAEMNALLDEAGIDPACLADRPFQGPPPRRGRLFPLSGGVLPALGLPGPSGGDILSAEGSDNVLDALRDLAAGRIAPRLLDLRLCRGGCLGPPDGNSRLSPFARGQLVRQYAERYAPGDSETAPRTTPEPELRRRFGNRRQSRDLPSGENIRRILHATDKFAERDELNCGACGYAGCREHAAAVCRGLAREDMCLPFFVKRLEAERRELRQTVALARHDPHPRNGAIDLVARDAPTRRILRLIDDVAPGNSAVLLRGECGTGKETMGRILHGRSSRAARPLAVVNCTALDGEGLLRKLLGAPGENRSEPRTRGLLEMASGSTVLLDEIGDAPPPVQQALVRLLEDGTLQPPGADGPIPADVRLLVTSRCDLEQGLRQGWFSRELFFLLSSCTLVLPPLHARPESLPELARRQLTRAGRRLNRRLTAIEPAAMELLTRYRWPGNIRELADVIERTAILCDGPVLRAEHLPPSLADGSLAVACDDAADADFRTRRDRQMERVEKSLLERYLRETSGNVSAAAQRANLPRRTFYRLLERHGIKRRDFAARSAKTDKP